MNSKISFKERAVLAMMRLSKQSPSTLEAMRAQARRIRENSTVKEKKQRDGSSFA